MRSGPVWRVDLLADHAEQIPAVGELRWREWGHAPEPEDLSWWIDVTRSESGRIGSELTHTYHGKRHDGAIHVLRHRAHDKT
jgi:hypothetical protein